MGQWKDAELQNKINWLQIQAQCLVNHMTLNRSLSPSPTLCRLLKKIIFIFIISLAMPSVSSALGTFDLHFDMRDL